MEVDAVYALKVGLIGFARTYYGVSYDEGEVLADKVVELLPEKATPADAHELMDLVWGASLSAGIINPGDWNNPVHPLSIEQQLTAARLSDTFAEHHSGSRKRPVEYNDETFVAKKPRKKKRRAL